jgi:ABC-type sugar transport system, auxiliary component
MKRSQVNRAIKEMEALTGRHGFALPDFCKWTPEEWQSKGREYDEIRDNMLGWDITDFGSGDFDRIGFALITLRNGNLKLEKYKKPYAEKLLMLREGQYALMHFHWSKMEDIINRGGGNILIRVYNSLPDGDMDRESGVTVHSDGRRYTVAAGTQVKLCPGGSITIMQGMYHDFNVEPGTGAVLLGEVSMVNDDANDNRFYEPAGRFPAIEEDEPPCRLLCNEYPRAIEYRVFPSG